MFQDMLDAPTEQGEVSLLSPSRENYGYVGKPFFKPTDCCGATPAWDAFWFIIPWESYQHYGDIRALEKTYPAMLRYLDNCVIGEHGRCTGCRPRKVQLIARCASPALCLLCGEFAWRNTTAETQSTLRSHRGRV